MKSSTQPIIMGVLNLTPDSFSDGGEYFDNPINKAFELIKDGANILDVGGESTGPNSKPISVIEEISRLDRLFLTPEFDEVKRKSKISIDTYKSEVAEYALRRGISIVNDISALRNNLHMAKLIADYDSEVVLMFSKENGKSPLVSEKQFDFTSIVDTIIEFFDVRIEFALSSGISEKKIILDPGMGAFLGKNPEFSWQVVKSIEILKSRFQGFRILCGVSRKSFISSIVDKEMVDIASKIIELDLILSGVDIIRTHNVRLLKKILPLNDYR